MSFKTNFKNSIYTNEKQLETESKIETDEFYKQWNKGCYNFLIQRTENHYNRDKADQRRKEIEKEISAPLPILSDEILQYLYLKASIRHERLCRDKYEESGYQETSSERKLKKTLKKIINSDPKYKNIEVYPDMTRTNGVSTDQKMIVGNLIPDFLVFGIKSKGCTSICFEVNGDAHVYKYAKDFKKEQLLESLGIRTLPIENDKASDEFYIKSILDSCLRARSGSLDLQILRNKRKIWVKTITCNLSLIEVEEMIIEKFGIKMLFRVEAGFLLNSRGCPRNIKAELKVIQLD